MCQTLPGCIRSASPDDACIHMQISDFVLPPGALTERDAVGLKRFFLEKYCNKMRKPTGQSAPEEFIRRPQKIYEKILAASAAGILGNSSADSSGSESSSNDSSDGEEEASQPSYNLLPVVTLVL